MSDKKQTFELVVNASTWDDVVQILKDELSIHKKKRDTSVRNMQGLFIFEVSLDETQINKDLYKNIRKSNTIAIHHSPLSARYRNEILESVATIEVQLRKLLLHVSDLAEEYYKIIRKKYNGDYTKKETLIITESLDPATSRLTFGEMIDVLDFDLSWKNKPLTTESLLKLLEKADDTQKLKKEVIEKQKEKPLWDIISSTLLVKTIAWNEIKTELNQLKNLRDKAAHFRTLTPDDRDKAKMLSKDINNKLTTKNISSSIQKKFSNETYKQFTDALYNSYFSDVKTVSNLIKPISDAQMEAIRAATKLNTDSLDKLVDSLRPSIPSDYFKIYSLDDKEEDHEK